jgi:hypothetical protein
MAAGTVAWLPSARLARSRSIPISPSTATAPYPVRFRNEAPSLFRQQRRPGGNWVILKFEGASSNRSAFGS